MVMNILFLYFQLLKLQLKSTNLLLGMVILEVKRLLDVANDIKETDTIPKTGDSGALGIHKAGQSLYLEMIVPNLGNAYDK